MSYAVLLTIIGNSLLLGSVFSKEVVIHNKVIIHRDINVVFEFLKNYDHMTKWNYYLLSVEKETSGDVAPGTIFSQVRQSDHQKLKLVELTSPHRISIETLPPERHLVMQFTLTPLASGTLVEDTWTVQTSWLLALVAQKSVQRAVKANLLKLKTLLETGSVVLQDGRLEKLP